jgi:hypothetical protein
MPLTSTSRSHRPATPRRSSSGPVVISFTRWGKPLGAHLSDRVVAYVRKRRAVTAGIDTVRLSGNALRAGLATAAARTGQSELSSMALSCLEGTVLPQAARLPRSATPPSHRAQQLQHGVLYIRGRGLEEPGHKRSKARSASSRRRAPGPPGHRR